MYKTVSCLLILALGTWVGGSISPVSQFPRVVAKVALTNQTGSIPSTTLLTPTTSALYRISVYMVQVFPQTSTCDNRQYGCGNLYANYQWTDDGGTQVMDRITGSAGLFYLPLYPASGGQDACAQSLTGTCVPMTMPPPNGLPGATFLVRANAGTPFIYSVQEGSQQDGTYLAYDYFMTVEQLE
jgi:hypothetical protein